MPSDLVSHFTQSLASSRPVSPSPLPIVKSNTKKPELHSILVSFNQFNPTQSQIADCARSLQDVVSSSLITVGYDGQAEEQDEEEVALEDAIVRKSNSSFIASILFLIASLLFLHQPGRFLFLFTYIIGSSATTTACHKGGNDQRAQTTRYVWAQVCFILLSISVN